MWSIFVPYVTSQEETEELSVRLWALGTCGVEENSNGLLAFFDDSVATETVRATLGVNSDTSRVECIGAPAPDQADCEPILIGSRFIITSGASEESPPHGRFRLTIEAGAAFGTGRHETTQMMLQAVERLVQPSQAVLDVGCGSGILSKAVSLLGARVYSCDIDEQALSVARAHLGTPLFIGSVDSVRSSAADIVLVNISARIIDRLAFDLNRVCKKSGVVVLSGFITQQPPTRFAPIEQLQLGEWLTWICRPDPTSLDTSDCRNSHPRDWWI